jgi:hypothetical protein
MALDVNPLVRAIEHGNVGNVCDAAGELLLQLRAEPELVTVMAHPVGFAHVALTSAGNMTIRLHLWPLRELQPQKPRWLIHRHAWPLTSYVFRGSVRNHLYDVSRSTDGRHRLYSVGYEQGDSIMKPTDIRVSCDLASDEEISAGNRYDVSSAAFHSTVLGEGLPAATIAVTGPPSAEPPFVVGSYDQPREYRFERRLLTETEAREVFACFG